MLVRAALLSLRLVVVFFVAVQFAGCSKKRAAKPSWKAKSISTREIPPFPSPTPGASVAAAEPSPSASAPESAGDYHEAPPLAKDEVVVDTYVMKKNVRGTKRSASLPGPRTVAREGHDCRGGRNHRARDEGTIRETEGRGPGQGAIQTRQLHRHYLECGDRGLRGVSYDL